MRNSLLALAFLVLLASPAVAQLVGDDTAPGDSCAGKPAGATRMTADPDGNGADITLICDGSTWNTAGVRVYDDPVDCDTSKDGTIRYLSTGDPPWEYCDGSAWENFKQPRCEDDDTGECYLDSTRDNDDPDFTAANIAIGINILGVAGTLGGGSTNCDDIGDTCDDGTIYAGDTPDGGDRMYTTDADAPSLIAWNDGTTNYTDLAMENCTDVTPGTASSCQTGEANTAFLVAATGEPDYPFAAAEYCDGLELHGQDDWYLPAQDELDVLYTNKNAGDLDGTFNETGSFRAGYYWSSSENKYFSARGQKFSDGGHPTPNKGGGLAVRCVRKGTVAGGGLTGPSGCANIGDLCADGTVFAGYRPVTQEHLFIPPTDQGGTSEWKTSPGTDDIDPDSISDGRANTDQVPNSTTFPAFKLCKDLGTGGHSDWYLPSQVELYYLWAVHETIEAAGNITNFQNAYYWSSTEYDTSYAWYQSFTNGLQNLYTKANARRVRCVRR